MKRFLAAVCSTVVLFGGPFTTEAAIPMPHVSIDVRPGDSGGAVKTKVKVEKGTPVLGYVTTDKFENTRVRQSGIKLNIDARNTGSEPAHVRVEWVFYTESADGKGDLSPHGNGGQDLDLPAAGTQRLAADSGSITRTTKKQMSVSDSKASYKPNTMATIEHSGRKLRGWYVRLLSKGQVVQVRASGPSFEKLGQSEK